MTLAECLAASEERAELVRLIGTGGLVLSWIIAADLQGQAETLQMSEAAHAALEKTYSGDIEGAIADAVQIETTDPEQPLGYVLEAEALWWRIWCTSAEFKYGMTYPRHRAKLAEDRHYFDLAAKVSLLAQEQLQKHETAEMHFYAATGDALAARLYALRGEGRNTARAGVRAREHFLKAVALDPDLDDAYFGLGLYNYYVDTLSAAARILRFFMGLPGGSKQEGIRQLQRAMEKGELTSAEARFYLAINLHNYDQQYERALEVISPLAEKYPSNPIFHLARGDLLAKLGRKEPAAQSYQAAAAALIHDAACQQRVQTLAAAAIAALGLRQERR